MLSPKYAYVVMRFDDRNRYGQNGIPANILFSGGARLVVSMRSETISKAGKRNRFAKVSVTDDGGTAQLVELLGAVGEYSAELEAYQLAFGIKPCRITLSDDQDHLITPSDDQDHLITPSHHQDRLTTSSSHQDDVIRYPKPEEWGLTPGQAEGREDCRGLHELPSSDVARWELGIHVADVAARIPPTSPLFQWAAERCASTYHSGITDEGGGSVPMLPPQLAHDELSLNEGVDRCAISLFLTIEDTTITSRRHARTLLCNRHATNYAAFGEDPPPHQSEASARTLLRSLSGQHDPEDLVAWTMIEYNSYFGQMLADLPADGTVVPGLVRHQVEAGVGAVYAFAQSGGKLRHESLQLANYAHCSSPIRRYPDLHNQHVLFTSLQPSLGVGAVDEARLQQLNERAVMIKWYHARVDTMELAYRCREASGPSSAHLPPHRTCREQSMSIALFLPPHPLPFSSGPHTPLTAPLAPQPLLALTQHIPQPPCFRRPPSSVVGSSPTRMATVPSGPHFLSTPPSAGCECRYTTATSPSPSRPSSTRAPSPEPQV
ncbi:MAG: hypothetical protein SGPRY_010390 [Prymnesium sp.]